ncbi:hypothetical protein G6F16_008570 [Rhizopus arrhizus]|nr:hypothetical protein G6F23_002706 [Rhizopus arrhizus]KAG0761575.1 hypothetical protein G6F24_007451 [Rhizopus arrhizus]KAG0778594.1 hypothetical protein G6F22_011143 [Rhizopus arrhizus]KAG0788005.1 hypothetical protein G6F21_007514 [Rhizopus arrhizus]KAG0819959.1 hypothetical protein G6F20_000348 [Rhizopus arrhizus]
MFRCNEKKVQWYLQRKLATTLESEPNAIRLNFEAKGDGHKPGDYMIEERTNVCVSCGKMDHLTLHHVVPDMYRQWMPLVIKSKSSRDLLLLCKQCHTDYEVHATTLKKQFAKRFDIPLEGKGWVDLPEHRKARKAASALLKASDKIPKDRQLVLEMVIKNFWKENYENETVDWQTVLKECSEIKDHFKGPDFIEHGNSAIQQLTQNHIVDENGLDFWPDLERFIKEWRQHFLDHMKPKYLSKLWSVEGEIYSR